MDNAIFDSANRNSKTVRFLIDVIEQQPANCVIWPFCRLVSGYGQLKVRGRSLNAHRYALMLLTGDDPPLLACHNCGYGSCGCVNPYHCRWDTHTGNMVDMVRHGHTTAGRIRPDCQGVRNGQSKLSESDVVAIFHDHRPTRAIGREYGVSFAMVARIKRGISWGWLTASR